MNHSTFLASAATATAIAAATMVYSGDVRADDGDCTRVESSLPTPTPDSYTVNGVTVTYNMWTKLCYADGDKWTEYVINADNSVALKPRQEQMSFYFPTGTGVPAEALPLIIYAHPRGVTEKIPKTDPHFKALVFQALKNNFAFASVEFRHPVTSAQPVDPDDYNSKVTAAKPDDISNAVQYMRLKRTVYNIRGNDIFLVGQSRGSLALMSAFNPIAAVSGSGYKTKSSEVNAVFAYQGQTFYNPSSVATNFVIDSEQYAVEHGRPEFVVGSEPPNTYDMYTAGDPPVYMTYREDLTDEIVIPQQQCFVKIAFPYAPIECDGSYMGRVVDNSFDIHDPRFGLKLKLRREALAALPPPAVQPQMMTVCYGVTATSGTSEDAGYEAMIPFFQNFLTTPPSPLPTIPGCP